MSLRGEGLAERVLIHRSPSGVLAGAINLLTKDGFELNFGVVRPSQSRARYIDVTNMSHYQNVMSHVHLTMLLLPALLASPSHGRVINVSSEAHRYPPPGHIQFDRLKNPPAPTWIPGVHFVQRYQWYGQVSPHLHISVGR